MEQPKFDKMTSLLLDLGLRMSNDVLCKGSTPLSADELDDFVRYAVKNQYTTLRDYGDGWVPSGFKNLIDYQRHAIMQELVLFASSKYYGQMTTKDAVLLNKPTVPACTEKTIESTIDDVVIPEPEEIIIDKPEYMMTTEEPIKVGATGPTESERTNVADGPFAGLEEFMVDDEPDDDVFVQTPPAPSVIPMSDRPVATALSVEDEF